MGERGRRSGVPDLTQHRGVATKVISSGRFWGIGTYPARRAPNRRTPKIARDEDDGSRGPVANAKSGFDHQGHSGEPSTGSARRLISQPAINHAVLSYEVQETRRKFVLPRTIARPQQRVWAHLPSNTYF